MSAVASITSAEPVAALVSSPDMSQWSKQRSLSPTVHVSRSFADVPRAASYTHLARTKKTSSPLSPIVIERPIDASDSAEDGVDTPASASPGCLTPDESSAPILPHPVAEHHDLAAEVRRSVKLALASSQETSQDGRSSLDSHGTEWSVDSAGNASTAATTPVNQTPRASVASTLSHKVKRRSWVGASSGSNSSRSPSPDKSAPVATPERASASITPPPPARTTSRRKPLIQRNSSSKSSKAKKSELPETHAGHGELVAPVPRRASLLRRTSSAVTNLGLLRNSSPSVENGTSTRHRTKAPSLPNLPKSFSTDRLPLAGSPRHPPDVPVPRVIISERALAASLTTPKKKDPLWSTFRDLDGDFAKFNSKTLAFKTNVVRSSLLPFLRDFAKHPSNWTLRAEDLDRRTNILNKWWTGLIEMLHGRNNQSIAGTDRPAILDGVAGIMERPEWRLSPSPFSPKSQRKQDGPPARSATDLSTTSTTSEFLAESVHQNVRNIFIQNLCAQVVFTVDKMSLRNAPASLVNFCGKAAAYAFMFVPGMADVLVRLWDLPVDSIRRVLQEHDIGKFEDVSELAQSVVADFPPPLRPLGFTSLTKYTKKLRVPPPLPLGTLNVQWWGSWLERWSGRESDLFYVFVKHFHILASDFLPAEVTAKETICAPGFVLVQAQILTNLDATIHRGSSQSSIDAAPLPSSPAFDSAFSDPDAIAPTLPVPPTNAVRIMAENRLIMLIRDFLSDRATDHPIARQRFAVSFNAVLQSAARGTSMFDHGACYTLLDFLEEALVLLVRYERARGKLSSFVNPEFWQTVSRRMLASHNTMTEIRLYAFLYGIWSSVLCEVGWKTEMCMNFLLDPEIFARTFNHWCPMVRAYYMRLLCWRVGRYDGEASNLDLLILETLLERLQTTWLDFSASREHAEHAGRFLPSTQACDPAPGRRLLIIRTDGPIIRNPNLLSFDGILPPSKIAPNDSPMTGVSKRASSVSVYEVDTSPTSPRSDEHESPRGIGIKNSSVGVFFRSLIGGGGGGGDNSSNSSSGDPKARSASKQPPPPPSPLPATQQDQQNQRPRPSLASPRASTASAPTSPDPSSSSVSSSPRLSSKPPSTPPLAGFQNLLSRPHSFKFSLEPLPPRTPPHQSLKLHFPPRLPVAAQRFLNESGSAVATSSPRLGERTDEMARSGTAAYAGRALAEWALVLAECQAFFERRRSEGVQGARAIETPGLGIEVFRRPG